MSYRQGGYEWFDYQLVDGEKEIWMAAEDDDGLFVAIYTPIKDVPPEPVPRTWTHEGHTFHLDESGSCEVLVESELSAPKRVQVEYWDFETDDDVYLSVENWQGDWEASIGREIKPYELEIYPRGNKE